MIAIMGGTFDPIHQGHLYCLEETYRLLNAQPGFDHIKVLPIHQPPHKSQPMATPQQRLAMTSLAIDHLPYCRLDDAEIRRGGTTYTIDTLRELRHQHPDTPLVFIWGTDSLLSLETWEHWEEILENSHCLVFQRPDHPMVWPEGSALKAYYERYGINDPQDFSTTPGGKILIHPSQAPLISSTAIREALSQPSGSLRSLLPKHVTDYLITHSIYSSNK